MSSLPPSIPETLTNCCQALEDKQAKAIRILYLGAKSSLTDYYLIATGNSLPHLKALSQAVKVSLHQDKIMLNGLDNRLESGWLVIDAYSFMVHLFTQEQRDYYDLENLWKDAHEVAMRADVKTGQPLLNNYQQ